MGDLDLISAELEALRDRISAVESEVCEVRRERTLLDRRLEGLEAKLGAVAAHQGAQDALLARVEAGIRAGTGVAAGVPSVVVLACELARAFGWL